jgi:hypothetical protein
MTARENRLPHRGVLAGGRELAAYAEVTPERARQLTLKKWWTLEPLDFIGGRFVYSYPAAVRLLNDHGYPRRLHPDFPPPVRARRGHAAQENPPKREHRGVLAGIGEIARTACVPTSRATKMTQEKWWTAQPLDHLAGGTVYSYPDVAKLLEDQGYPRRYKTIGARIEAQNKVTRAG